MIAPIIVSSNLIVDDVWLPSRRHKGVFPGGAALWAAIGARYFWPEVSILAGVGDDVEPVFGPILDTFGIDRRGHVRRGASCIRSRLEYAAEDSRNETPTQGANYFEAMQVSLSTRLTTLGPAAGTYVFRDLWPEFWQDVSERRGQLGLVLWELQRNAARPDCWPKVADRLSLIDIFSVNAAEARTLTGAVDAREIVDRLHVAGARIVALRQGVDGALLSDGTVRWCVRPAPGPVVDVTGGGNAFCGGLLAGLLSHPGDLAAAGRCAAAAAALCIAQFGTPARRDATKALALAATVEVLDVR